MSRIDGPSSPPAVPAEPESVPAHPHSQPRWRDIFSRPRTSSVVVTNDDLYESVAAERDDLERYVTQARRNKSMAQIPGRGRQQSPQGGARAARTRHERNELQRDGEDLQDNDDLQTRRLLSMHRGATGGGNDGSGGERSGTQQVRLFAPSLARLDTGMLPSHPLRRELSRIEAICKSGHACDAPREYFVDVLDASLRTAVLVVAQSVSEGARASVLLAEMHERLGVLYARHAHGLIASLDFTAKELMQAIGEWRAPKDSLARMDGLFVALPAIHMTTRRGLPSRGSA